MDQRTRETLQHAAALVGTERAAKTMPVYAAPISAQPDLTETRSGLGSALTTEKRWRAAADAFQLSRPLIHSPSKYHSIRVRAAGFYFADLAERAEGSGDDGLPDIGPVTAEIHTRSWSAR